MAPEPIRSRAPAAGEIPVVDVAGLAGGDLSARRRVARRIGAACRDVGFFYVTGHGFSDRYMAETFDRVRYLAERLDAAYAFRRAPGRERP